MIINTIFRNKYTLIFIYGLASFSQLFAQNIPFEKISTEAGLSQSSVTSVVQDCTGFIWIGTYDGLNRYDGYNYKVFKANKDNPDGLSHSFVRSLVIDFEGRLWVGTMGGGINIYNKETETFVKFRNIKQDSNSISSDLISALHTDKTGNLWIGTWGSGLNRLDLSDDFLNNPVFEKFNHQDAGAQNKEWDRIADIYEDTSGNIWMGSNYGLTKYTPSDNQFYIYRSDENDRTTLSSNDISSVCEDKFGNIWAGTWKNGLNKMNVETNTFTRFMFDNYKSNGPSFNMIMSLYKDRADELWVGTWGGGLNKISQKGEKVSFTYYKNEENLNTGDFIYTIFEDKTGVLWAGTDWQGVSKYDKNKLKFVYYKSGSHKADPLNQNAIFTFLRERNGDIWIGTRNSGINVFNKKKNTFRNYLNNPADPYSLMHNGIRALYDDLKGSIWIGTEIGLERYDYSSDRFTHYRVNGKDLLTYVIYDINEDDDNNLWIGTFTRGLFIVNPKSGKVENYLHDPDDPTSISGDLIRRIYKDKKGLMWLSTENDGLNVCDPHTRKFKSYKNNIDDTTSINSNRVICIIEDSKGNMWFGTGSGLNKLIPGKDGNPDSFVYYTLEDGLSSNTVQGILEDDSGNLWLSTTNGLSKFNPENETFKNYNVDDGLQGREFNGNSVFIDDKTGEFYFGGVNGFNVFHPDSIRENIVPPNIVITDFRLANKKVTIGGKNESSFTLEKSISYSDKILLDYHENTFSLEFAALHFSSPKSNQYLYKLENFDQEWHSANYRQRIVSYTNLDPGSYKFRVKAANNDGIWNETGRSLQITITPPYSQNWWFRILLVAFIIYILTASYRYRTRIIQDRNRFLRNEVLLRKKAEKLVLNQNISLEKAVKEKTQEMEEMMDKMIRQEKLATIGKISGSIAHELRNPLGAVRQSVYFIKMKFSDVSDKLTKHLKLIDEELSVADRVINNLLEMTRLKSVNKEQIDLDVLINQAIEKCNLNSSFKIEIAISPQAKYVLADQIQLQQVFVNVITNAVQAMDGKGRLSIKGSILPNENHIQIDVQDSGSGIKKNDLNKVFEPLYTSKSKGTGLGLSICKQIIEKHNGEIKISSKVNQGTKVSIVLPLEDE